MTGRASQLTALAGAALGLVVVLLVPADRLFVPPRAMDDGREDGVRWACAMMDYIAETRGNGICPVCGMKLERITAGALRAEQRRRMGLETTQVTEGPALVTVRAYGTVRYDDRAEQAVIARVAGRVVAHHPGARHAGHEIIAGEPLIDLSSPEALSAGAELAAAVRAQDPRLVEALAGRLRRLNLGAEAERIIAGGEPTDRITIVSPVAGRVLRPEEADRGTRAAPAVGSEVMADQVLLRVADPRRYIVAVHVPEVQARFLRVGQPVRIASDDAGELPEVEASVDWLASELTPETRTREAHLHLRDAQGRLFPGSLVSARIAAALAADLGAADPARPETWGRFVLVPKSAVLSTGVRHVAWRRTAAEGGAWTFALAPLALGPRLEGEQGDDRYIVRHGLAAGEVVATQGAFLIDSQAQLVGTSSLLFPDGAAAPAAAHQH